MVEHGVSVHYTLQSALVWEQTQHEWAKIVITLDAVETVVCWEQGEGMVCRVMLDPHVLVVPAKTLHHLEWRGPTGLVVLYVEPHFLRQICETAILEGRITELRVLTRFDLLIREITEEFRALCHGRQRAPSVLVQALGTILAAQILKAHLPNRSPAVERRKGLSAERLRHVSDYIEANLRDKLPQRELAREANLSEFHFARMFRLSTKFSPREYVIRRRVLHARELLLGGTLKVAAVAAEVGFCDQSHLVRHFTRIFGHSPGSIIPVREHDYP
ncbi:MAG: AraC family transcriptional regulator [bacterium]|nr:AraC family transcriptional regulator [bacterium]